MGKGKGMSGIAARLGMTRVAARQLVANGKIPATVEDGVHIVAARHIRGYLAAQSSSPKQRSDTLVVGRREEANLISDRPLQAYRHEPQAVACWEGEGGALPSNKESNP